LQSAPSVSRLLDRAAAGTSQVLNREDHFPIPLHIDNRPSVHFRRIQRHVEPPEMRISVVGVLAFSVGVVGAGWLVFDGLLREMPVFSKAAELIHKKIGEFGIDSVWKYALLAGFYSLFHSLLEEYYWRWFTFRQLRRFVPLWPALLISALAFMGHHVIVLLEFFEQTP
jgi:membrane protease YdiL (CAAX protease family)